MANARDRSKRRSSASCSLCCVWCSGTVVGGFTGCWINLESWRGLLRLRTQLKSALEQYDLREKHFEKLLQTKELEKKLVQAQAAQELQAHKADMLTVCGGGTVSAPTATALPC